MRSVFLLGIASAVSAGRPYPFDGATKMRDLPVVFSHAHTVPATRPGYEGSLSSTYTSPPMPLRPGEVVFTNPYTTKLSMPAGKGLAIQEFHAEIVDDKNISTPLSEVYNHHWLVFDRPPTTNDPPPAQVGGNGGVCGGYLSYIFGVGAEGRNSPVVLPAGHGYVTTGDEEWSANIHLLRTVGLANGAQGMRDCIECAYAPSKGCHPDQTGLFACCGDGSFCAVEKQQNSSSTAAAVAVAAAAKTYFLRCKSRSVLPPPPPPDPADLLPERPSHAQTPSPTQTPRRRSRPSRTTCSTPPAAKSSTTSQRTPRPGCTARSCASRTAPPTSPRRARRRSSPRGTNTSARSISRCRASAAA